MEARPFSHGSRFIGWVLVWLALPFPGFLVWEMTWKTWWNGPQVIGYSLAHTRTVLYTLGAVIAYCSGLWCWSMICLGIFRVRTIRWADWKLFLTANLIVGIVLVPYSTWQSLTIDLVGLPYRQSSPELGDALQFAVAQGGSSWVKSLLNHGVDVNHTDRDGNTALCVASLAKQPDMAALVLSQGAKVNARCQGGKTALHLAAEYGQIESVRILLKAGADTSLRSTAGGATAADLARPKYPEIVRLLEPAGPSR